MKKTFCHSVRVKSCTQISPKAVRIETFDGRSDIFPSSQVFHSDFAVHKSEALWIAAWILEKKDIQWSSKKSGWYNPAKGKVEPVMSVEVEKHVPEQVAAIQSQPDAELIR
jgi:hypothetical protein